MGMACGDLDGDGRPDLAVTNFYGESTTLYRNLGGGQFADRTAATGLATRDAATCSASASCFLDADNDGRLDLVHGQRPRQRPTGRRVPYAMPAQLFLRRTGGGRLVDVSAAAARGPLAGAAPGPRPGRRATSTTTAGSTC